MASAKVALSTTCSISCSAFLYLAQFILDDSSCKLRGVKLSMEYPKARSYYNTFKKFTYSLIISNSLSNQVAANISTWFQHFQHGFIIFNMVSTFQHGFNIFNMVSTFSNITTTNVSSTNQFVDLSFVESELLLKLFQGFVQLLLVRSSFLRSNAKLP